MTSYQKPVWNRAIVLCQLSSGRQGKHSRTGKESKYRSYNPHVEGKKLIFIQFGQCQHFHLHACSRALQHIWTPPSKYISGCCAKSYTSQTYVNIQRDHTEVVEAPWGQPLREVGGKQETGEEGEEEVVTVTGQGVALAAAAPAAEEDLDTEKQPGF